MAEADRSTLDDGTRSTIVRTAVAAAATGAAAYGVQQFRARRHGDDDSQEGDEQDDRERDEPSKREELTQTLTSKASDAKKAAGKLKPGGGKSRPSMEGAWESAEPYVRRFAKEAAASLGATAAKKAPDIVRDEVIPSFIDGFEKAS